MKQNWLCTLVGLSLALGIILAACGTETATPTPTPAPTATATATARPVPTPTAEPNAFLGVPGILDPTNFDWPREVEGTNGRVVIPAKPQRIITASIGHDEVTYALVPFERVVAVGAISKDLTYSNVAYLVQDVAEISRDPEVIVGQSPDVIVTSPFFDAEVVGALERVGVPVVQTKLSSGPEGHYNSILLMGYIYGEEERAVAFALEVAERFDSLKAAWQSKPESLRTGVLSLASYLDKIYTAGSNSTEGGIIEGAGGINVAASAGLEGNPTISLESIIAMDPGVIIITQPPDSGEPFKERLLGNDALAGVPAIKDDRVYVVDPKLFTTLSFWNIGGVEALTRILWPEELADTEFAGFSSP